MANRSRKKPFFVSYALIKAVNKAKATGKSNIQIKTYSRASTIYPDFLGFTINVYNGKIFIPVSITEEKLGRKLGEFSPTRKYTKRTLTKNNAVAVKKAK